ncbi:MAG TPA: metalloregulator ArsR/SmtB family transcription factor [Gemmatimonadaceae bacterium]|nr:metalloregulator ArsR/SmtB family transcription factor [Gemmatimonadaceae bacterium]
MTETTLMKALKALAHPTRFRMVQEIAAGGEMSCGQLGARFRLAQPTVSHHLKMLADAGVVRVRQEAQHRWLTVDRALIEGVLGTLPSLLAPARPGRRPAGKPAEGAPARRRRRPAS